jgi:CIC family chloride channel protein
MLKLREALAETSITLMIGGLIGAVLGIVSNVFVIGVESLGAYREASSLLMVNFGGQTLSFSSLLFLWIAAATVLLIKNRMKIDHWAGPADSIFAAQQQHQPLNIKQGFASTLGAFVSASGGASVGQYGPIVHFGATVGVWVKRFVSSRLSHDIYLGCGVAAAISAGFNAPIAGVIFAHEAVLRHFSMRAIAPITVASISASTLGNYWFPNTASLEIEAVLPSLAEVVPTLIVLAPLFSLIAILFMVSLRRASSAAEQMQLSPTKVLFLGATLCGLVGVWIPQILGLGISSMNQMIAGEFTLWLLATVLVAKILMTAVCLGCGLPGGTFSPALFIGVATGALAGQILTLLGFSDIAGIISVAAMAAVSSAVIGAPLSAVMIVLELTQSYQYAVAAMMAVVVCSLLTNRLFGHSFFDRQLLDRGINLALGREAIALSHTEVGSYGSQNYTAAAVTSSGDQLLETMRNQGNTEAYVVDKDGILLGKLSIFAVLEAGSGTIADFMDTAPLSLYTHDSLEHAMAIAGEFVGESLPIIELDSGQLMGTVTEGSLFQAVIAMQKQARSQERS